MNSQEVSIEFLINPFCLCDRDFDVLNKLCNKHGVTFDVYNLWNLEDKNVDKLPEYMSILIRQWRSGQRPGSVYSNVFVNGERIPLNDWPKHIDLLEGKILAALGENEE